MVEIDKPKDFASRDAIPDELRADFDYLESHMMFKVRIFSKKSKIFGIQVVSFFILIWLSRRCKIINSYWAIRILIMLNCC